VTSERSGALSVSNAAKRSEAGSPQGFSAFSSQRPGDAMLKFGLWATLFLVALIAYTLIRIA
jgi:hypothetical protein